MNQQKIGNFFVNQEEVDSNDQHIWRKYRRHLYRTIFKRTEQNNFEFVEHNQIDITQKKSDILVSAYIYDLINSRDWFDRLNDKLQACSKKLYFFTDNVVGESYRFSNIEIFSIPEILGITANFSFIEFPTASPGKLYNCFIQRADSVRQSWFYFLFEKNLLNKGYVSYLLKQLDVYSKLTDKDLFTWIHNNFEMGSLPHFQNAFSNLINQVPYRNFVEQNNLIPLILDSKYSLNLETYANRDQDCWCFTEKSLRSLQLPTIDLMFLQTGGYTILKNLGFELLDHSEFDNLPWQERQQKILEILTNDTVEYNYNLLKEQAYHNQDLMLQWKKQIFTDKFFDKYFDQIYV